MATTDFRSNIIRISLHRSGVTTDVMVHRLLERYLDGGKTANAQKYEDMCKHSSDMENKAASAERSSIKYKQVEFMQDKIGQEFSGVISGVTRLGNLR